MVVYPGAEHGRAVAERIRVPGVEQLDLSELFEPRDPGMALPHDGHPTARAIGALAQRLADEFARR
jgi:hypothetical protein